MKVSRVFSNNFCCERETILSKLSNVRKHGNKIKTFKRETKSTKTE